MTPNPRQYKPCGAKTRSGRPCRTPGMPNGRCRMHGGTSPGRPIIHGRCTKEAKARRRRWLGVLKDLRTLVDAAGE